jgi:hemerythrin-like domain-containing protein
MGRITVPTSPRRVTTSLPRIDPTLARLPPAAAGKEMRPPTVKGLDMDALSLLKEDHDKVKNLLKQLDETTERAIKTREELFTKLKRELEIHETIEEEIIYPAMKQHAEAKDLILEAYEEHDVVNVILRELVETPYDDETWGAKLTVMKENLEHHIEEEEGEMFKQARDIFDRDVLEQLGVEMAARKESLKAA